MCDSLGLCRTRPGMVGNRPPAFKQDRPGFCIHVPLMPILGLLVRPGASAIACSACRPRETA
jgi:hypothetical protein